MSAELHRVASDPGLARRMAVAVERFWFAPADPTPLAAVRIFGGLLILYVHLVYCFDFQAFFGKDAFISLATVNDLRYENPVLGLPLDWPPEFAVAADPPWSDEEWQYARKWDVDPRQLVAKGSSKWSVWYHVTDPTWMAVCHGGILLAMFCLMIGFCTRVAAVLTWLGMLSYVNRAPTTLFGMDTIMIVVATYLMIGPSGAVLSVDRLIARWRARRGGGQDRAADSEPQPLISANLALRLLQIHLCIIYFASGVSKLQGATWWSGTAVWGTMANYEFSPMRSHLYMSLLRFLAEHRVLWELVMTGTTTFTLAFEIAFPFVIWVRPLRWVMIASAVFLHLGIAFFMGLVGFSTIMIALLLSFVPAEAFHRVLEALGRWAGGGKETEQSLLPTPGSKDSSAWPAARLSRSA